MEFYTESFDNMRLSFSVGRSKGRDYADSKRKKGKKGY